jgi:acyl carrier protein
MQTQKDVAFEVTSAWCAALGITDTSAHADFFELGGTSLTAIAFVERIEQSLGIRFPLPVLFVEGRLSAVIAECEQLV